MLVAMFGCGPLDPASEESDGGALLQVAPGPVDAGSTDAGAVDAGSIDAGPVDAGATDAGSVDAGAGATDGGAGCGRLDAHVGWYADLTTRFHGVSGRVTVTDDCTLTVTGFNYDGQGIDVRFYAAPPMTGFAQGTALGPQLYRPQQPWQNETLVVALPAGLTPASLDRISVWCIDVGVDFGSGAFRAP